MSCSRCEGTGTVEVVDFVDYGSAKVQMRTGFECPECLERGLCPGCELPLPNDREYCPACSWRDKEIR